MNEKLSKLLSGDDIKAIQKIVISIGHMCVKETSASHMKIALDLIFSLCRSKVGVEYDIIFFSLKIACIIKSNLWESFIWYKWCTQLGKPLIFREFFNFYFYRLRIFYLLLEKLYHFSGVAFLLLLM